jgi:hypothetical protein
MCSCAPCVALACCVRQLQMVAEGINGEAFAQALVMLELLQVRDIQSKVLIVGGDPVLLHFRLVESL